MKYTLTLDIALPRARVVELFDNPENWDKWQESLVHYEAISGTPGEEGSKTKLLHYFGRRKINMVETVESKTLPDEMVCIYEAPGAWNRVAYRFSESSSSETCWEFETEFRCTGVLKIMALLMPRMFRKASLKDMNGFKRFAETNAKN